jgi:uncharacterized protein YhfF
MEPLPPIRTILAKLAALKIAVPAGHISLGCYGDSPALSESLLALIRQGRKRAGTSLLWAHEFDHEPISKVGVIEIVLDHRREPAIITRITQVSVMPFSEVTAEYAAIEGEGDGSLEYWRKGHWTFFSRECQRIVRVPTENMPVVCSVFEVVQILPSPLAT